MTKTSETTTEATVASVEPNKLDAYSGAKEPRYKYQRVKPGAYHDRLVAELREAVNAASFDDFKSMRDQLVTTKVLAFDRRSQRYKLRFGVGRRCVRIPLPELPTDQVLVYESIEAVRKRLMNWLERAESGEFDDALEVCREQYVKTSACMVQGRNKAEAERAANGSGDEGTPAKDARVVTSDTRSNLRALNGSEEPEAKAA